MEWDLKTIGISIAIFFIGYLIGLVEAAIKQKNKDKKKTRKQEKELMEIPPAARQEPKLLSMHRDPSNDLILELEGETFSNKDKLAPEKRRLLVDLLVEVRPWLETQGSTPAPSVAEKKPEPIRTEAQTATAKLPPASIVSPKITPVPSDESIVSQINTVLQNRLVSSPLANQGIRLQESPSGGVCVYIGLNKYDGIDAVPDPEIQTFIRKAVAEWEEQS